MRGSPFSLLLKFYPLIHPPLVCSHIVFALSTRLVQLCTSKLSILTKSVPVFILCFLFIFIYKTFSIAYVMIFKSDTTRVTILSRQHSLQSEGVTVSHSNQLTECTRSDCVVYIHCLILRRKLRVQKMSECVTGWLLGWLVGWLVWLEVG